MRVSGRDEAPISGHPIRRQFTGAELARQHLFLDRDRAVRRHHASARLRELGLAHQPHAHHRLHPARDPRVPGVRVRHRGGLRDPRRALSMATRIRPDVARGQEVSFSVDAILSLIATLVSLMVFLLMLEESLALTAGRDPITNDVRSAVRRFPRVTYAIAVVIGMVLGHLLWP